MGQVAYIKAGTETSVGTIARDCGGDRGHWYCEFCRQHFGQNFQAGSHVRHGLVWVCDQHGPEEGTDGP